MTIQTVFLDAGGVLLNPNWERVSAGLAGHGVAVAPEVLEAAEPRAKKRLDAGPAIRATTDQQRGWTYFDLVLTAAGVPLNDATRAALAELQAYHQESNLWETVREEVPTVLAALRAHHFRLVVVSNANGTLRRALDRLRLTRAVDVVIDSHEEGVEKPDPRLFRIALERSGADPLTTIHVGDLYHVDVIGARAAGIRPVLLDTADLYADCDCPRVRSLAQLAAALTGPEPGDSRL